MPTVHPERAPLHPAIHLAPRTGWMNDPNGLCFINGVWHAFYQHDPDTDIHGTMHWGHAASLDLLHWIEHPIALEPDELGVVYSGSVVVDRDDTAGFGAGAMVAVFTHHLAGVQRQSLAFSLDQGATWTKYSGNPVLESDERDFRDPKVFRHVVDGQPVWVMSLAVGRRVEFYRSIDLRSWELTGAYSGSGEASGLWECPDLVRVQPADGPPEWLLTYGVVDGGPFGHSATFGVLGEFDGREFRSQNTPAPLDHGPDFYAAQSFSDAPDGITVLMTWLNSWQYSRTHPSAGRRGVLSLPRRLDLVSAAGGSALVASPAMDLTSGGVAHPGSEWRSVPGRALHVAAVGDVDLSIESDGVSIAGVSIAGGVLTLDRCENVVEGYAQSYRSEIERSGSHEIIVDHGTVEVFAGGGSTTMSALVFPGKEWAVRVGGDASLMVI